MKYLLQPDLPWKTVTDQSPFSPASSRVLPSQNRIENLLHRIKELSSGELGITLSVGEQKPEVYKRWFDAGAHRYLLTD